MTLARSELVICGSLSISLKSIAGTGFFFLSAAASSFLMARTALGLSPEGSELTPISMSLRTLIERMAISSAVIAPSEKPITSYSVTPSSPSMSFSASSAISL